MVRLVVPAGPVQNGNVDPEADWVTPFEQQTGCRIQLKNASTGAQALTDITRGIGRSYYDGILASPEVAGQLIEAGAVRPLDVQRITGYTQLSPTLRSAPSEVSGSRVYGMPYSWDSYVIGYDAGKVKPAPQSWRSLFDPASAARYGGKITVPDAPVTLALAALYLKSAQPSLGITDPFELTKPQLAAAAQAVTAVRHNVGTFWTQDSLVIGQLGDGQDVLGAVLSHQIVEMARAGLPTASVPARHGKRAGYGGRQRAVMDDDLPGAGNRLHVPLAVLVGVRLRAGARFRVDEHRAREPGGLYRAGRG